MMWLTRPSRLAKVGLAVVAMVVLAGCQLTIPGFDGTSPPTQGSWLGRVVFVEAGKIPFDGGQRTANVTTTYEVANKGGLVTSTWVQQQIHIQEQYPPPAGWPVPGECYVSSVTINGTISGWADSNVYLSGTGGIGISGGDASAQSGPKPVGTIIKVGDPSCAGTTYTLGIYEVAATNTGPWTYNGPRGSFDGATGYSGRAATSSSRWLDGLHTTVSWDVDII